MSTELIFFLIMAVSLSSVFFAGTFGGKSWLLGSAVVLAIISSVTAGKIIDVFGFSTSVATPIYAGIFLATDALSEFYGKKNARQAVWMGLFANILLIGLGQLIISTPGPSNPELSNALNVLFSFIPRLVFAGVLAFVIAQSLDIYIFHFIREKTEGKHLWLRNNVSTIFSQFLDSTIVYTVAFWGIIPNIWDLILVAWITKMFVAVIDTPFMYLMKNFMEKEKVVAHD